MCQELISPHLHYQNLTPDYKIFETRARDSFVKLISSSKADGDGQVADGDADSLLSVTSDIPSEK